MSRPHRFWLVSIGAIGGIVATLALGQWQLGRGRAKDALQAAIDQRETMPVLAQSSLLQASPGEFMNRQVVLHGAWDPAHTVFLDNRQMRGAPGFYVVTPLKLEGSDRAVLVQRGWAPRNFEQREKLPPVDTPAGIVEISGRIAPPPARLYEFSGDERSAIRQNLDLASFRAETGLKLVDVSVVQAGPASEGLLRDWPRPAAGSERNYGYAVQWWAMSALIAILYVWFQFIAPRRKVRPPQ
ncbi:MAG TPA: SURF1 family protein [Ramlibacter sp.]|nr:SURF1 family protein [Ramlibacter sp.]